MKTTKRFGTVTDARMSAEDYQHRKTLNTLIGSLPLNTLYVMVRWPFVRELMEYRWFLQECYPHPELFDTQEFLSSAYFVPLERMLELKNQGEHWLRLFETGK